MFFPHPLTAQEDGLLAIGGDLSTARLLLAYQYGIFPWYNEDPILWWFTYPRAVVTLQSLKESKSMKQLIRGSTWYWTVNRAFEEVMHHCATVRRAGQEGTWITEEILDAYSILHRLGIAHSVEVWEGNQLVGGLYGVLMGEIFYGESMFAFRSNASKFAFICFARHLFAQGCILIDCQQDTPHMRTLGAHLISKEKFWWFLKGNLIKDNIKIIDPPLHMP